MPSASKIFTWLLYIFLIFYFGAFFAQKINLTTADLGRHIINGREILQDLKPIRDNHYSYTEQFFTTIMHHWGAGVIYYVAWVNFDFIGVSFLHIFINGLAVLIFYLASRERSSGSLALLFSILTIPLISTRVEVRPEEFSALLLGIFVFLLERFRAKKISFKLLLPALMFAQLLWVNVHIFFVFGLFIVGVYALEQMLIFKDKKALTQLILLILALVLVSLINPFGLKGFLEPFNIFRDYGYMIAENQSVFFMQKRIPQTMYLHFEAFALLTLILGALLLVEKRLKRVFVPLVFAFVFGIMSLKMVRIIPIFGLFFVFFAAESVHLFLTKRYDAEKLAFISRVVGGIVIALVIVTAGFPDHYFSPVIGRFGLGLAEGVQDSAEFFLERGIEGPVLNNYDIGGYLIFNLYPDERVFVDNRPEAYSVNFFNDTYVPLLRYEDDWQEKSEEYGFNAIYFYRRDITQWAQPFLINRIRDPAWVPVYVDDYALILVRDTEENKEVIEQYRIPEGVFVVTS